MPAELWLATRHPRGYGPRETLLRAATYLKWFRDQAITVDTRPPNDLGEIIVVLEQLADQVDNSQLTP